ncbi:MAG: Mur ligase family protein [Gemmatimonadota bacterium]
MLTYAQALDFLFPRTTTIKFGLETTRALLAEVGNPEQVYPTVHVGGTNGKGSVATLIATVLETAGWKVGLYTSPHLVSFRERVRVNREPISESAVAMWTDRLEPMIRDRGATFFEATTVIALSDFASRGVEVAVVEVGLGGRLDSTNVLNPLVSVVTRIALDHMKYLGDSLTEIAREKAGIAKPGASFVIGETDPEIVTTLAIEAKSRMGVEPDIRVVPADREWDGLLGLAGPHQKRNAAVAEAALLALPLPYRPREAVIASGFAQAHIPGRFDRRGKWVFDVAHNPDGMRALVKALREGDLPRPIHALVSILGDKEWPEMLVQLDAGIDRGILTMAPTAAGRGWNIQWLEEWLNRPDRPPARAAWSLVPDFSQALEAVQAGAGTVVVTGSFHTVGDVMETLGMAPI